MHRSLTRREKILPLTPLIARLLVFSRQRTSAHISQKSVRVVCFTAAVRVVCFTAAAADSTKELTALAPQLSQKFGCSCPLCLVSLLKEESDFRNERDVFLQGFGPARIHRIFFLFFWKRGTLQRDAEIESF
jgi:hypothetical protein